MYCVSSCSVHEFPEETSRSLRKHQVLGCGAQQHLARHEAIRCRFVHLGNYTPAKTLRQRALAEIHWYEAHGIGKKEFKRKRYLD